MLVLIAIATIGAAWFGYVLVYQGVDLHVFAETYVKNFGLSALRQDLDDRTVFLLSVVGDLFNLFAVPPLCWAVLRSSSASNNSV